VLGRRGSCSYWWECRCDCGEVRVITSYSLRDGLSRSCGCLKRENLAKRCTTHGRSKSKMYSVWQAMRRRCENPEDPSFLNYGARGITVCERWQDFQAFYEDMGSRPSHKHTIERIDNSKGYEPSNCKWATRIEQNNNTSRNVRIEYGGRSKTVAQWARELGMNPRTFAGRIERGWSVERAIETPADEEGCGSHGRTYMYQGTALTSQEWAERLGIPHRTMIARFRRWPIEKAIIQPLKKSGR
jgi:AraC-like DNA-binding protein